MAERVRRSLGKDQAFVDEQPSPGFLRRVQTSRHTSGCVQHGTRGVRTPGRKAHSLRASWTLTSAERAYAQLEMLAIAY